MKNFTQTKSHAELVALASSAPSLRDYLQAEHRQCDLTIAAKFMSIDFSRQRLDRHILNLLNNSLIDVGFNEWRNRYFAGDKINKTENRAVLHTAQRVGADASIIIDGVDIVPNIIAERNTMLACAEFIRTDRSIKNVIAIGIGGSDLGPRFIYDAFLGDVSGPQVHFVSNVDGLDLARALKKCEPDNTIIIIASKTFTTVETMLNAKSARTWMNDKTDRFYAVTANPKVAHAWGVATDKIFPFSESVGGRFSVWSSIGMCLAIAFGADFYRDLLSGAHDADEDFKSKPYDQNPAILMALCGVWNRNYLGYQNHLMAPYDVRLRLIAKYVQQMDMESNGKSVDREGQRVNYKTAPHIYGEAGTDCQHSYMQLVHQGTDILPIDFFGIEAPSHNLDSDHHKILLANLRAQAKSLAFGQTIDEAKQDPFRVFEGNRPSTIFMLKTLTPRSLGYLIAIYEHKIFTQGVFWNLNSYDQPGVELGKVMATEEMMA